MTDRPRKYPVAEIFGPTVQGEGMLQGMPCHFVRFGGCDFRCEWCDTPHAVLPAAVRANERLTTWGILHRVDALAPGPRLVVLSGGNPALHDLSSLVTILQGREYKVAAETQGSTWRDWLHQVNSLCVSPKPPSSLMATPDHRRQFFSFMRSAAPSSHPSLFLKIVVFDKADYDWAKEIHQTFRGVKMFLSAGNDAGRTVGNPSRVDARSHALITLDLLTRSRWLTNMVMVDPDMADVRVQSQYHVLLWGNDLGR